MKLIDKIKNHPAVKSIVDEGQDIDAKHHYWCYLKCEYIDAESACNSLHEFTLTEIWYRLVHYTKLIQDLTEQQKYNCGLLNERGY